MAETLTSNEFPYCRKITTNGSANVATQVTFPAGASEIRVYFESTAGKVAYTGTDAVAIDTNHYVHVPADAWLTVYQRGSARRKASTDIFIASGGTSVVCRLMIFG